MKNCISCGMPLDEAHGLGTETEDGRVCQYCLGEDGHPKTCEEVFESGVAFFLTVEGVTDRDFAERLTRKNMSMLEYWDKHGTECLKGEQASHKEFFEVIARL